MYYKILAIVAGILAVLEVIPDLEDTIVWSSLLLPVVLALRGSGE